MSSIEAIARRIHAKSQAPDEPDMWRWITSWCPSGDWKDIGDGPRDAFIAMARASVEAMEDAYDFDAPVYLSVAQRATRGKAWEVFLKESGTPLYVVSEPTKLAANIAFWRAWSLAHSNGRGQGERT